ncbi:MAG: FtsQ-type POTRA domain-containing protein [Oscillospiraceae bacterium]|nr:FtsQ-type POTRA domain-containing protein [Oscillospiraceae bacterium]
MESRKQRRISKSAAIYIPIGVLLIILFTLLGISSFLQIMDIQVVGAIRHSAEDIISVSGISAGDNLMFLDTDTAERRITTAMPFISEAFITRLLPDSIKIEVVESSPIAAVESRGDVYIIDSAGRILERTDSMPSGLIVVRGITPIEGIEGGQLRVAPGGETQLQHMRDVLTAFIREDIVDDISYLDVTHIAQINFGYLGRFRVILGSPSNLRQKLTLLLGAVEGAEGINERFGENAMGDIDLSDPAEGVRFILTS